MSLVKRLTGIYYYWNLIGVAFHEASHYFIAKILPGIKITEVNIFKSVTHEGRYTATRMFLISYAPLFINSVISIYLFYYLSYSPQNSIYDYFSFLFILLIGSSIAFSSLPSYRDCINPFNILKDSLFSLRFPIVLIISPIFIVVGLPFLILTYISKISDLFNILIRSLYLFTTLAFGFIII